jgi:hypothetical protein
VSAGIVLALLFTGCTRNPDPQPTGSAAPASPALVASPDPGAAGPDALAAYRGMWQAYTAALALPDPAYPDLTRYADGEALELLTTGIQETKDDGLKGIGDVTLNPEVASAAPVDSPTTVEITDCLDSTKSQLVRASPGPPYSDSPGGKRRTTATVSWQPTGWKVTSFAAQEVGTC